MHLTLIYVNSTRDVDLPRVYPNPSLSLYLYAFLNVKCPEHRVQADMNDNTYTLQ